MMARAALFTGLVGLVSSASPPPTSFCAAPGWAPAWHDDFDGDALDAASWTITVGDEGGSLGACRSALCARDNVAVHDGALFLTTRREAVGSYAYTTGAVNTSAKRAFTPADGGTFRGCVSARLPGHAAPAGAAQGLWPAIWWMPDDASCDPDEGEMDVLEMISGHGTGYATYHWQSNWPATKCAYPKGHEHVSSNATVRAWNTTFHEFAVERAADYVAFVYDGVTVLNSSGASPPPLLWSMPFYLIINTALGGSWPGEPTADTVLPVDHVVDYVTVSRRAAP